MLAQVMVISGSFLAAIAFTVLVRRWAAGRGVVDKPGDPRNPHVTPVPLLGGTAIYLTFTLVVWGLALLTNLVVGKDVSWQALWAFTGGGLLLMLGGYLDDRYRLSPAKQIVWPALAALLVLAAGVHVSVVTNPWGGLLELGTAVSLGLTFVWLMGTMYTTKLLDGMDGLASGIGAIGGLIIFGLTQFTPFYQPPVGFLALSLAGAALGFLVWNFYPAKIFLGEGGSLYLGFVLGVLAIISGAKIATTLLVMGIPILDVAWVIVRRLFWDKQKVTQADRKHLHYRLLDAGLTHRQAVVILYLITASFGLSSLFLRTQGKLIALGVLLLVMTALGWWVVRRFHEKKISVQRTEISL